MENTFGMNLKPVKDDIKRIVTAYLQEIEDAKAADAEAEEEGGEEEEGEGNGAVEDVVLEATEQERL